MAMEVVVAMVVAVANDGAGGGCGMSSDNVLQRWKHC